LFDNVPLAAKRSGESERCSIDREECNLEIRMLIPTYVNVLSNREGREVVDTRLLQEKREITTCLLLIEILNLTGVVVTLKSSAQGTNSGFDDQWWPTLHR